MKYEEAFQKAKDAFEMGLIEYDQIEAYTHHLLEINKNINKNVGRDTGISTDSNTK